MADAATDTAPPPSAGGSSNTGFEPSRFKPQPGVFPPFCIPAGGGGGDANNAPLSAAKLPAATELITFRPPSDPHGPLRCLRADEMAWHHVAQGAARGEPFAVSFCGVCNSAAGFTPLVDGTVINLEVAGLYNGVAILQDPSTGTLWDHMTGAAVHGPQAGARLATWSVHFATAAEALARDSAAVLYAARTPWLKRQLHALNRAFMWAGMMPPTFLATMAPEDTRLPRATLGVGVAAGGAARFYPLAALEKAGLAGGMREAWQGKEVVLQRSEGASTPEVTWGGAREGFQQFYLRWYGFSQTYPRCSVFGQD